jgi:hypothetical protein
MKKEWMNENAIAFYFFSRLLDNNQKMVDFGDKNSHIFCFIAYSN